MLSAATTSALLGLPTAALAAACNRGISTCIPAAAHWWKDVEQVWIGLTAAAFQRIPPTTAIPLCNPPHTAVIGLGLVFQCGMSKSSDVHTP